MILRFILGTGKSKLLHLFVFMFSTEEQLLCFYRDILQLFVYSEYNLVHENTRHDRIDSLCAHKKNMQSDYLIQIHSNAIKKSHTYKIKRVRFCKV